MASTGPFNLPILARHGLCFWRNDWLRRLTTQCPRSSFYRNRCTHTYGRRKLLLFQSEVNLNYPTQCPIHNISCKVDGFGSMMLKKRICKKA
ncbi:MAG: hypothetical protein GWP31_02440 [Bacteroidetes bacterium]|nr:hypothetical protein [Bacteroidota bacterium]